jgi:hypothetical protein
MQRPMDNSRYEEAEEIAQIVDMVPSIAIARALHSADEAS